jgi:cobalamin biosynthesis Co2+ chelatase CbiK
MGQRKNSGYVSKIFPRKMFPAVRVESGLKINRQCIKNIYIEHLKHNIEAVRVYI